MRVGTLTRAVLAAAVAIAVATPTPAHAQFGKLLKKAKNAVAGEDSTAAAGGAPAAGPLAPGSPKFDETVIELTPSVVDQMLRGMTAEVRAAQSNAAREEKLNADISAIEKEYDQLRAQHPNSESDAWHDTNNRIEQCISDEVQKRQEQNEGEAQARLMSDPAARQKMIELSQRVSAEMQRGDTVAAKKTMAQVQALTYPSAGADSAAAIEKCGKPVPKPAWMAREEELDERRSRIAEEIRKSSGAARDTALAVVAKGGGKQLTAIQYSMALERMIAWAALTGPGAKGNGKAHYSSTELDALKGRDAELRKLTGDLRALNVWR
ncbi:MAG TPA: hypothetical protein VFR95_10090 [Gemmatimonadaceae bacterium]|nr:hypothetical protein [Gemmatimonadaceae bacterium]